MASDESGIARRDPVRTRRALLDAASAAVAKHGSGVSVDVIARTAGVSKSGLLHHFNSKDQLFVALAQDAFDRFERQVESMTKPDDLQPGRLARGYIRAVFADIRDDGEAADYWSVVGHLSVIPAVIEVTRADSAAWEQRLTADGLDPTLAQLLLLATAGAEMAEAVGHIPGGDRSALERRLLALSYAAEPLREIYAADIPGSQPTVPTIAMEKP